MSAVLAMPPLRRLVLPSTPEDCPLPAAPPPQLAVVGLRSALAQFVDFSSRVVSRLRRMEVDLEDTPVAFQGIRTRLPLMIDLVGKIMRQMDAGIFESTKETQDAMLPIARSCVKHAEQLQEVVDRTVAEAADEKGSKNHDPSLPAVPAVSRESSWSRGQKSGLAMAAESEVARIDAVLKANLDVLAKVGGTFQTANRLKSVRSFSSARSSSSTPTFSPSDSPVVSARNEIISPQPMHATTLPSSGHRAATFHSGLERRATTNFAGETSASPGPPALSGTSFGIGVSGRRAIIDRLGSVTPSQTAFMVPFPRDVNFVGRNEILKTIEQKFKEQTCVALTGLGGIGKTQIVIEYAYTFREKHPKSHVFWVYGNSITRFQESYEAIARKLMLPGWDDSSLNRLQLVLDWFNNMTSPSLTDGDNEDERKWLLILDNADDASTFYGNKSDSADSQARQRTLAKYIPINSSGSVLLTTRDRRVGERLSGRQRPVEITLMTRNEARELLQSKVVEENWSEADGLRLVEELSYLPLAITQAAAFISENNLTVSEYLDMLYAGDADIKELLSEHLEDSRRELDAENSVMRTWKLSFDQLSRSNPRATEILSLLSVLDYHNVHLSLLRKEKETEFAFRTGLGALQAFHLITVGRGKDGACKMHRLLALSMQKWLELCGRLEHWQAHALHLLESKFPKWEGQDVDQWELYEALTPHTRLMFATEFSSKDDQLKKANLLCAVTLYHLSKSRYHEAVEVASRALDIRQSILPADDPLTLDAVQTIGEALLHDGELLRARSMLERAVTGREKSIGPEHFDTLDSMSDLTITLLELDEHRLAEVMGLRALRGREKVLGPDDAETIVSENIMAMVRHRQGRLDEANELGERVLARRERLLGWEHPHTIITRNNLARLYFDQGRYDKARELFTRVLEEEERVLGGEGYDIQVTLCNAALVMAAQGEGETAERLIERVKEMRARILGPDHPSVAWAVHLLLVDVRKQTTGMETGKGYEYDGRGQTVMQMVERCGHLMRAGLLFD